MSRLYSREAAQHAQKLEEYNQQLVQLERQTQQAKAASKREVDRLQEKLYKSKSRNVGKKMSEHMEEMFTREQQAAKTWMAAPAPCQHAEYQQELTAQAEQWLAAQRLVTQCADIRPSRMPQVQQSRQP